METASLAIPLDKGNDRSFADRAATAMFPLAGVLVLLLAADLGFVGFNHLAFAA